MLYVGDRGKQAGQVFDHKRDITDRGPECGGSMGGLRLPQDITSTFKLDSNWTGTWRTVKLHEGIGGADRRQGGTGASD